MLNIVIFFYFSICSLDLSNSKQNKLNITKPKVFQSLNDRYEQRTVRTARVMQWKITDGQNQTKKLLNMRLRHAGIRV